MGAHVDISLLDAAACLAPFALLFAPLLELTGELGQFGQASVFAHLHAHLGNLKKLIKKIFSNFFLLDFLIIIKRSVRDSIAVWYGY